MLRPITDFWRQLRGLPPKAEWPPHSTCVNLLMAIVQRIQDTAGSFEQQDRRALQAVSDALCREGREGPSSAFEWVDAVLRCYINVAQAKQEVVTRLSRTLEDARQRGQKLAQALEEVQVREGQLQQTAEKLRNREEQLTRAVDTIHQRDGQLSQAASNRQQLERHISDLNERIKAEQTSAAADRRSLQGKHSAQMTELQGRHSAQMMELQRKSTYDLQIVQQQAAADKERHTSEMNEMVENHNSRMSSVSKSHERAMKRALAEFDAELKETDMSHTKLRNQFEADIVNLQTVLSKRELSTGLADEDCKLLFQDLVTDVEQLATSEWRSKIPKRVSKLLQNYRIPGFTAHDRLLRKRLVQDCVWRVLIEEVFQTPFKMLGPEGKQIMDQWKEGYGTKSESSSATRDEWPQPSIPSERWKAEKIELCQRILKEPRPPEYDSPKLLIVRGFEDMQKKVHDAIMEQMKDIVIIDGTLEQRVTKLITKVFDVWFKFGVQRYRLIITSPHESDSKSNGHSKTLSSKDPLNLIVTPELRRIGTLQGNKFFLEETVICKFDILTLEEISKELDSSQSQVTKIPVTVGRVEMKQQKSVDVRPKERMDKYVVNDDGREDEESSDDADDATEI